MKSRSLRFTRRALLRASGAGAVLAPFLPLLESDAEAQPVRKRILFFYSSNGTVREKWLPTMQGGQLALSEILAPLEAHKADLLVMDGLGYDVPKWNGHNLGMVLTGSAPKFVGNDPIATGISVDQRIAGVMGADTRFRSLELGIQVEDFSPTYSALSYRGAEDPIRPDSDLYRVFNRVTAAFPSTPQNPRPAVDPRIEDRRSVLDLVRRDLAAVRARIGAEDRRKMDGHLESVREIERTLQAAPPAAATPTCTPITTGQRLDVWANDNIPTLGRLAIDLMVAAMACDLTRVGTIQHGRGGANHRLTWLGPEFRTDPDNGPNDATGGIHALAHNEHNPTSRAKLARCHRWYAGEVEYLVRKLKSIPEGAHTMAHNTLVVWCNELGTGSHSLKNTPWVLVGSAGGHFKTGRVLSFPDQPHNRLLVSLCQAMGLPDTTFGVREFGDRPLAGLT